MYYSPARIVECVSEYVLFLISKKKQKKQAKKQKQTNKQKQANKQKHTQTKETKEEKRKSPKID